MSKKGSKQPEFYRFSRPPSAVTDIAEDIDDIPELARTSKRNPVKGTTTADASIEDVMEGDYKSRIRGGGNTWADFLTNFFSGKIELNNFSLFIIVALIGLGISVYMYIQDNGIGRLNTQYGIEWYFYKIQKLWIIILVITGLLLLISLCSHIYRKVISKRKTPLQR